MSASWRGWETELNQESGLLANLPQPRLSRIAAKRIRSAVVAEAHRMRLGRRWSRLKMVGGAVAAAVVFALVLVTGREPSAVVRPTVSVHAAEDVELWVEVYDDSADAVTAAWSDAWLLPEEQATTDQLDDVLESLDASLDALTGA